MPLILEGIVTTQNADDSINVSPMGPVVDESMKQLLLRPFPSSQTYKNLARTRQGVFHVVDDVELIANAAVGIVVDVPATTPAQTVSGYVLSNACRSYEFEVSTIDDSAQRVSIECQVTFVGRHRDFFGFNRAKHAVLEAAILATRLHLLPRDEIEPQWQQLKVIVDKTCGEQEERAFGALTDYVTRWWSEHQQVG